MTLISNVRLIDGVSDDVRTGVDVVVEGDRIAAIEPLDRRRRCPR